MKSVLLACAGLCAWTTVAIGDSAATIPVKLLSLSGDLFDMAVQTNDPLLAIAAAKLRKQVVLVPGDLAPEGGSTAPADWKGWEDFLATAAEMAIGDPSMLELIEDVVAESSRGRLESPAQVGGEIAIGEKLIYRNVTFQGGDYAEVYVEGSGASDLNLYIRRVGGQLVCSDSDASDRTYCGWLPDQTSEYDIEITNKGGAANRYTLITN